MQLRTIFTVGSAAAVAALLGSASVASAVDADAVYADISLTVDNALYTFDNEWGTHTSKGNKIYEALGVEVGPGKELTEDHLVNSEVAWSCADMEVDIDLDQGTITVENVGADCWPHADSPFEIQLRVELKGATLSGVSFAQGSLFSDGQVDLALGVNSGVFTANWLTCTMEAGRSVAPTAEEWQCIANSGPDLIAGAAVFSFTLLAVEPDDEETPTPTPTPTPSGGTVPDNGSGDGDIEPAESASPVPAKPAFTG